MADTIKTNLGPVTAYADAKAHGYTGTREEFGVLLANAGLNLKAAEAAKEGAESAKTTASNSADAAANSATAAKESENNAGQSATAAANSATDAAASEKNAAASAKRSEDAAKVVPTAEISANTAARHSHTNKGVLDGITAAKTAEWDAKAGTAVATTSYDGLMSKADKAKLDGITAGGGGSGVQPDWNQNDSTATDYVKNRPFYTGDPVETVFVEESTLSFEDDGGVYMSEFESTFVPTVGETYKISWDGTVYECTCVYLSDMTTIGNLSIIDEGSDTGEPFVIGVEAWGYYYIYTTDTSASHTFSISGTTAPIVKIPSKYIDKDSSGYIAIHKNSTMTEQEAQNYQRAILRKDVVFIIWDGVCIEDINFTDENNEIILSITTQNGEAFSIKKNDEGLFDLRDRRFSYLWLIRNYTIGDDSVANINVYKKKVVVSPKSFHSGTGTTDVMFEVEPDGTKSKAFDVLRNGEAVMPAFILYSSTADSNKKFKITVDDSGTISATEVT